MLPLRVPTDWEEWTLGDLFELSNGANAGKSAYGDGVPFANVFEIVANESLTETDIPGRMRLSASAMKRYRVDHGDVLFNRTSETPEEVGLASVYVGYAPIAFGGFVFRARPKTRRISVDYSKYAFRADAVRKQIVARGQGAIRANIGQRDLKVVRVVLPPPPEQTAIAGVVSTVDDLLRALQALIVKKEAIHEGLMQALLTGTTRLPGFSQDWRLRPMHELLAPRTERNTAGEPLEVLSCTKHLGFVRSLDYFKTQVFSRDLSSYLVIHRGDIGYPANHVEEGSIGVQEIVGRGLVSPIYVVMRPKANVDSYFLHRQLKLNAFRQEFARVTNASVNRRGSLRWPEFSQISVHGPEDVAEQRAVAAVLRDSEAAIESLYDRLAKTKAVRKGMLQALLTGRSRVIASEAVA